MIQELLEQRDILNDIASELYGPLWIMNRNFWGSPTEKQLAEVCESLYNLGYRDDVTPEQEKAADEIAKILGLELPPED